MLIALNHIVIPGIIELLYYRQVLLTEAKQSCSDGKNYHHLHYHNTWEA